MASSGGTLHGDFAMMLAAAHSLHAAAAHMSSHAVPTVVPPAGLDEVSIKSSVRLNARAAKLVSHFDEGSWVLTGAAVAIQNAAAALIAQEAENAGLFARSGIPEGAAQFAMPDFPMPPVFPDVPIPDVPAAPGVPDAQYYSTLINGGAGEAPHAAAADFWRQAGDGMSQAADVIGSARTALAAGWQSPEAEAAHTRLASFHHWAQETGHSASQLGRDWGVHLDNWKTVRDNIPTPEDAGTMKSNLLQAISDNAADGGMSTPRVVSYTNEYNEQNATTSTEMNTYNSSESGAPASVGPGAPPPISSQGPPRVNGIPRPGPGSLQDRLTDDPALKGLKDPKMMMTALMGAVTGAAGGLGAFSQVGKGVFGPLQQIPQQLMQQMSGLSQMAAKAGAPHAATLAPHKATSGSGPKKGGAGAGKGGGGGVKPAGLGGGKMTPPPPVGVPAAMTGSAVKIDAPSGPGRGGGMAGAMPMGGMPIGAAGAAAARDKGKDRQRNKALSPDGQFFDDGAQDHVPAVLGGAPEAEQLPKKPEFERKLGTATLPKKEG